MLALLLFGALIVAISLAMIARPEAWGRAILRFSRWRYMHVFEIVTRLGFGLLLVAFADAAKYPALFRVIGYVLLAVGLGLLFTPPSYHRRFAVWSVEHFGPYFRPAAVASLAFGVFLLYAAL